MAPDDVDSTLTVIASKLLQSHITGNKALLITNDRIAPMYLERYTALLERGGNIKVHTLVLPDGEENKSLEVLGIILDKALEVGLDRKATFVALGGGVIGDMVGFASAIYLRGVNFVQVCGLSPTNSNVLVA
jgi:3-dehydroquinate synthase